MQYFTIIFSPLYCLQLFEIVPYTDICVCLYNHDYLMQIIIKRGKKSILEAKTDAYITVFLMQTAFPCRLI